MLPWIFAVLVLLNAGLFLWGYQREKSLEPPPTPVPEGRYEIRLLTEAPAEPQRSVGGNHGDAQAQDSAHGETTVDGPAEDGVAGAGGTDESHRDSKSDGSEASGPQGESGPDESSESTPGSGSTTAQETPGTSDAQSSTSEAMHEQPLATKYTGVAPERAAARTAGVGSEASVAEEDEEDSTEPQETGAEVIGGSKKPAEPSRQGREAPRLQEVEADTTPGQAEGVEALPPDLPRGEGEGTAADELSEGTR